MTSFMSVNQLINDGDDPEPQPGSDARNDPVELVLEALSSRRPDDAVRAFLQAADADGTFEAIAARGGEQAARGLIGAFAHFECPHCRAGFTTCPACAGAGHAADDRGIACTACLSFGVSPCDFCGGSGLATYTFMPPRVRPSAAATRASAAIARVDDIVREPLPTKATRDRLKPLRRQLAKHALSLTRDVAVLTNAAQFARGLREERPELRKFTGKLFAQTSRSATAAQHRLAHVLHVLAGVSRLSARPGAGGDDVAAAFEEDRADLFDREAERLRRAARRRASLFPGH